MRYEGLSWEGALIGPETLDRLSDENAIKGQKPADFGLSGRVRDEILEAWAEAKAQWQLFSARRAREDQKDQYGTTRTRQSWLIPFLALLGYELETATAVEAAGRSFAISHRTVGRACPVHVVGFTESLDRKRDGARSSPHSLVQEYLNLTDTLYALITNGLTLRLLRDSSRLIKLSYLEFNLERIFEEELFSDFAILFRLLHISRWPRTADESPDCLLEHYHQDSLENGSRIRERLSDAVKEAIGIWANGLLNNPANDSFRDAVAAGRTTAADLYESLLTLVYRILFLLVIEERDLTHTSDADPALKKLYREYYSLMALRARSRNVRQEEWRYGDLWMTFGDIVGLYEEGEKASKLGLKPLAGDLFSVESFNLLRERSMDNRAFADGMNLLDSYYDEKRGARVHVNYAALNVEEFGSIYEGLLDFDAQIDVTGTVYAFSFVIGANRGKSGSHYTPEELVKPLIEHALDPLIEECLKGPNPETRLLDLKVCDDACGSGHILLNAARRLALEVARLRTKTDNPDPTTYGRALRQVIERCIYGVDANPQAVRLCKVALWLESHNPGESLGFLDHHIRCGDTLVGIAKVTELLDPIPEAAFAGRDGDNKEFAAELRKKHKKELTESAARQKLIDWQTEVGEDLNTVIETLKTISAMPDSTPEETERKRATYLHVTSGESWRKLKALADIKLAPFFTPKRPGAALATEGNYRDFLNGREDVEGDPMCEAAGRVAETRRFFHWFLEFAEVMQEGGFDCFLGNPPFLGNRGLRGAFGKDYLDYLTSAFAPAGAIDLVGYFVRRNYDLLKENRALGTLATNTIAQGGTREGGLEVIEKSGGTIVMAVRSTPWPGAAAVEVSLAAIFKGTWQGPRTLDGKSVSFISTHFDDQVTGINPFPLADNANHSFMGSVVLGRGFVLSPDEAEALIARDPKNREVLFPYLNGEDLNSRSDQSPSRWVINFRDWPLDRASAPQGYDGPLATDYPDCLEIVEQLVLPERSKLKDGDASARGYAARWWQFGRPCLALYRSIAAIERVIVVAQVSKTLAFTFSANEIVFGMMCIVFPIATDTHLSILQSSFHAAWSWKYCSTMKSDLRYVPSQIFETFPFPPGSELRITNAGAISQEDQTARKQLYLLGKRLDHNRREIMTSLDIGLTTLYRLYHNPNLSAELVAKTAKCSPEDVEWAVPKIVALRELHREIDEAVRDAYGWDEITLEHGFHELEFLPENDRVRYTISNAARRLILQKLLELNHQRHAEEVAAGLVDEKGKILKRKDTGPKRKVRKASADAGQGDLF
ncbi:MAG TPA: type IIL restriction-modification enzyme MmeI [Spirochaetia bacterium]|nr:type IIL restriction-modification enzyme MmeI [Spirochaetia bacterium]